MARVGWLRFPGRARPGAPAPELARHERSTPRFLPSGFPVRRSFANVLEATSGVLNCPAKFFDRFPGGNRRRAPTSCLWDDSLLSYGEVVIDRRLSKRSTEHTLLKEEESTYENSRPSSSPINRFGTIYLYHDHRSAHFPRGEVPASSVQQCRTLRSFRRRAHSDVADQKRHRYALFARQMHTATDRRLACQAPRLQARIRSRV